MDLFNFFSFSTKGKTEVMSYQVESEEKEDFLIDI